MDDNEFFQEMAGCLEPVRPSRQEIYPIAPGKSWATIGFNIDDFSPRAVLFSHLKKLPSSLDVRLVSLATSEWGSLDVLGAVINGQTFAWGEESQIQVVGDTDVVRAIGGQICERPGWGEMPTPQEILPPPAKGVGWVEASFGRGHLDLVKLREALLSQRGVDINTFVPIEDFRLEELFRLFAVINGATFLHANMDGFQVIGSDRVTHQVGQVLQQKLGGNLFDFANLDAQGKPTRIIPVGPV